MRDSAVPHRHAATRDLAMGWTAEEIGWSPISWCRRRGRCLANPPPPLNRERGHGVQRMIW